MGTGGRPTGTTVNVTEQYSAICSHLLSSRIIDLGACVATKISDYFEPYHLELMRDRVRNGIRFGLRPYVSVPHGNLVGTGVKISPRDARIRRKKAMTHETV